MPEAIDQPARRQPANTPRIFIACVAVCAAASLILLLLVIGSPAHPVYDEAWFLGTLDILKRNGVSVIFLRELPGAPGPTFTLVYGAVQHLFALELPWLRLVNVTLLGGCVVLLAAIFKTAQTSLPALSGRQSAWLAAGVFVTLPTVAVSSGMTLTEIPAMFFMLIFVYASMLGVAATDVKYAALWSVLAGLALGMAVLGRQNYLVAIAALIVLPAWPIKPLRLLFPMLAALVAALLFMPVFAIWGGLLPRSVAYAASHLSPFYGVLSLGYFGLIAALVAPGLFTPMLRHKRDLWIAVAFGLLVTVTTGASFVPMHAFASRLSPDMQALLGRLVVFALSGLACAFVFAFVRHLIENRDDGLIRFSGAALFLGVLSNARIYEFSSRYVFVFLPFLLIAVANLIKPNWHLPPRLAIAAGIGLMSLVSYLY